MSDGIRPVRRAEAEASCAQRARQRGVPSASDDLTQAIVASAGRTTSVSAEDLKRIDREYRRLRRQRPRDLS